MTITVYRVDSGFRNVPDGISLTRPTDSSTIYRECRVVLPDGYTIEDAEIGPCIYNDKNHPCQLALNAINHSNIICVSQDGIQLLRNARENDAPPIQLREARLAANLTQTQLADLCDMNISQVQKLESGECQIKNIAAKNLIALADALDLDPRALI